MEEKRKVDPMAHLGHLPVKREIITLALAAMKGWGIRMVTPLITLLSKKTSTMVGVKVKLRYFYVAMVLVIYLGIGSKATGLDDQVTYAANRPAVELEFDFVSDAHEAKLACDVFEECLHIEALNTARCKTNVAIDPGFEDEFAQLLGDFELIVPSPGKQRGSVIEIGSDKYSDFETYLIYSVSCTSTLANVAASA